MRALVLAAACAAVLALGACGPRGAGEPASTTPPAGPGAAADSGAAPPAPVATGYVRDLSPEDFHQYLLDHGDVFVIDVRMPSEWDGDLGHLDRAVLIPAQELESRLSEVPADKHRPIAIYCRVGLLAPQAGRMLAQHGYREVVTLVGGLAAYRRAGF